MMNISELKDYIVKGKMPEAVKLVNDALLSGIKPQEIITSHLIHGMEEIGLLYENGKAFIPHLLLSARAMKGCLEVLSPYMKDDENIFRGTVIIGTVQGDLHDIGKNLVASMLQGCGFNVINLGVDVSAQRFVDAAKEYKADIVCLSALLTTTMNYMKVIIDAFATEGLRNKVQIHVGGAPVTQIFADKIGADGFSINAYGAVEIAKKAMLND